MLKSIYSKADEATVQKIFASVQRSLATTITHPVPRQSTRTDRSDNREGAETFSRPEDVDLEEFSMLGRSPSDLDPFLEARLNSIMDIDNGSHAEGVSLIEYDTEMPREAGRLYAKPFWVQRWMLQVEDERRGELVLSRCQSPET